jgi:hypothetical protein
VADTIVGKGAVDYGTYATFDGFWKKLFFEEAGWDRDHFVVMHTSRTLRHTSLYSTIICPRSPKKSRNTHKQDSDFKGSA